MTISEATKLSTARATSVRPLIWIGAITTGTVVTTSDHAEVAHVVEPNVASEDTTKEHLSSRWSSRIWS